MPRTTRRDAYARGGEVGNKDVAELLLANKANVNAKANERQDAFALCGG